MNTFSVSGRIVAVFLGCRSFCTAGGIILLFLKILFFFQVYSSFNFSHHLCSFPFGGISLADKLGTDFDAPIFFSNMCVKKGHHIFFSSTTFWSIRSIWQLLEKHSFTLSMTHWPLPAWHLRGLGIKNTYFVAEQCFRHQYHHIRSVWASCVYIYTTSGCDGCDKYQVCPPVYQASSDTALEEPAAAITSKDTWKPGRGLPLSRFSKPSLDTWSIPYHNAFHC